MDTPGDDEMRKWTQAALDAATQARTALSKTEVRYYGTKPSTAGLLIANYANMVLNRTIDLFDDALLLMTADRLSSACIIARCVMETHAVGMLAYDELERAYMKDGTKRLGEKTLKFINSSRFKMEEQKSLKEGKFKLDGFHFTEQAKARMIQEAAQSVHVLNAMRFLYEMELKQTNGRESRFELTYNGLSEWVHPSQTSLFHKYATETHRIETSVGTVSLRERTRWECSQGLYLIQYSGNLHRDMRAFAQKVHEQEIAETTS